MYNEGKPFRSPFISAFVDFMKKVAGIVVIAFLNITLDEDLQKDFINLLSGKKEYTEDIDVVLGVIAVIIAFLIIMAIMSFISWSKKYITVTNTQILWDKKVLAHKKKSISIQNISNINVEQSLLDLKCGVATVKIDTASKTTSDSTDFKIILKKNEAEKFKKSIHMIMDSINKGQEIETYLEENCIEELHSEDNVICEIKATRNEIINHSVLNINIVQIIITVASLIGFISIFMDTFVGNGFMSDMTKAIILIVILASTFLGEVYSLIKGFLKFFRYNVKRIDDKIHIQYGIMEKVAYDIPVDKINSICIKQSLFARMVNKYRVDMVNIGLGDDSDEKDSFLLLYDTEENIIRKLKAILPEFDFANDLKFNKQPKGTLAYKLMKRVVITLLLAIVPAILFYINNTAFYISAAIVGIIFIFSCIGAIFSSRVEGLSIEDECVKIVRGYITREFKWIKYDKIEYIELEDNVYLRHKGINEGNIYILADNTERFVDLPYMTTKDGEKLRNKVIDQINK